MIIGRNRVHVAYDSLMTPNCAADEPAEYTHLDKPLMHVLTRPSAVS
jgi:hypothetical protein